MTNSIVGRSGELQAAARFIEAVPDGGRALLIEGDAGIGKTVVWRDGMRAARERGFRVLAARAADSETQTAFATLGDLLTPALDEPLQQLVPVQRRSLEIALLRGEPGGAIPGPRELGVAVVSALQILAADGPVLIALDDIQWVDASSAEVLRFALRRLAEQPVGVLATVRGSPASAPLELDRSFNGFERLVIGPLSLGALHELLWERLSVNLSRPALVKVHETVGGNPFYALELGRALSRQEMPGVGHIPLPTNLQNVVGDRLDALPAGMRETLAAVAALAGPTVDVLEPLAPSTVDDLEHARAEGLLELDDDRIHFTHPLFAAACYSAMPLHARRRLHRRLADLDVDLEERARHLAIAATGPDEAVAVRVDAGAAHASARGAAAAAAELAELAVVLTPPNAADELNRRRITAGDHHTFAGDMTRAGERFEEVIASAPPGALRASALGRLASVHGATNGHLAAAKLYERALDEPGLDPRDRVDILCRIAWNEAAGSSSVDAIRRAETARAVAEELGDPALLAESLATLAELTFWRTGCIRRDLLDRAIELGRVGGTSNETRTTLARLLGRSDYFDEARALWTELISEQRSRGDPALAGSLMFLARMEVATGAWDDAYRLCSEGIEVARQTGREMGEVLCRMVLAEIDAYRGDSERARTEISALLRLAGDVGYPGAIHRLTRALASLELSCGDPARSWRLVEPLLDRATELDEVHGQLAGSVGIEALIGIGELAEAERLAQLLDDLAAQSDTGLRPLARRCRGLLLAARGELEPAIEALQGAASPPDAPRGANPLELARTLLALGTVERRARRKRHARETLELAAERLDRLGARLWAENARAEMRRIGGRSASTSDLSETERKIVDLVVAGRRNVEVAAALSLSPNTVAWNLSKIYRKLDVASRTELAARMAASEHE